MLWLIYLPTDVEFLMYGFELPAYLHDAIGSWNIPGVTAA